MTTWTKPTALLAFCLKKTVDCRWTEPVSLNITSFQACHGFSLNAVGSRRSTQLRFWAAQYNNNTYSNSKIVDQSPDTVDFCSYCYYYYYCHISPPWQLPSGCLCIGVEISHDSEKVGVFFGVRTNAAGQVPSRTHVPPLSPRLTGSFTHLHTDISVTNCCDTPGI